MVAGELSRPESSVYIRIFLSKFKGSVARKRIKYYVRSDDFVIYSRGVLFRSIATFLNDGQLIDISSHARWEIDVARNINGLKFGKRGTRG